MSGQPRRYAARLNSFKVNARQHWPGLNRPLTSLDLIGRAATVAGLNAVDFNYPDHLEGVSETQLGETLAAHRMALNGYAMRYYTDPGFRRGAFTNPDRQVRRAAIDLTRRGIDSLCQAGGRLMTLWMGQDGFDYSFQANYAHLWEETLRALEEVCDHNPDVDIAIEYKPDEPRSFSLMPDVATVLLAIAEAARPNLGVTLDFAHVLYAGEMPAYAAMLAARRSRILGVHLNDGYGKRDDGLMVGSVHPVQTLELLIALERAGYEGALYFDTFPDTANLDPGAECAGNIAMVEALLAAAARLRAEPGLDAAIAAQDAVASLALVRKALLGS